LSKLPWMLWSKGMGWVDWVKIKGVKCFIWLAPNVDRVMSVCQDNWNNYDSSILYQTNTGPRTILGMLEGGNVKCTGTTGEATEATW
jgi:hypothetical protein